MIERTTEDMCVVCNDHGEPSCGYEGRGLQYKCPFNDFIERGYELAKRDLGWHSVDDCLPDIDEEVIVLTDEMHGKKLLSACHISYGHRPNPDGWDGKSIFTGKVTHHDVITYDGWNIPGVRFWMPCPKIPKEEEK